MRLRRPTARTLLNLCTVASMLLLLGACTLWACSYWTDGKLVLVEHSRGTIIGAHDYSDWRWELTWRQGTLYERRIHRLRYWPGNTGVTPSWWPSSAPLSPSALQRARFFGPLRTEERYGFGVSWSVDSRTDYPGPTVTLGRERYMPIWPLALAAAVFPVGRLAAVLRRRLTIPPGHCRRCGYDLRATPERCPECGTPAA